MKIRSRIVPVLASLVLAATAVSCKKGGKGGDAGDGGGATSGAKASASAMSLLPKNAMMVIGINFTKGSNATFAKPFMDKIQSEAKDELAETKTKCGFNPMEAFGGVTVAIVDLEKQDANFAVVKTTKSKKELNDCATKMEMKVEEKGKVTTYTNKGESFAVHWADDNTMLVNFNEKATEESFKPALEGGGANESPKVKEYLGKAQTGAIFWGAGSLPPQVGAMAQGAKGFYASLDGDKEVTLAVAVVFEKDDQAKAIKTLADTQMKQAGMFLGEAAKKIKVEQKGPELTVSASFSEKDINDLKTRLGGMMGMMGGGM